jgi:tRNA A-37 threonylcarbamoyl transferase component Bud32
MVLEINNNFRQLENWLCTIPQLFQTGEGVLLYQERNQIRQFEIDGKKLVVKGFKPHHWLKGLIYTYLRKNKALRSFENARQLRLRGFSTPTEVAYLEKKKFGILRQVYYVCEYTDAKAIRPRLIDQDPFDENLALAYARFVVSLHEKGVLHKDLNPTNVLFKEDKGIYSFELIDINRMQFYKKEVPAKKCMQNLSLFSALTRVYYFILNEYARQRGWGEQMISEAVIAKQRHDKKWIIKKKLVHPFRK